jgi:hypothetical protein
VLPRDLLLRPVQIVVVDEQRAEAARLGVEGSGFHDLDFHVHAPDEMGWRACRVVLLLGAVEIVIVDEQRAEAARLGVEGSGFHDLDFHVHAPDEMG